jgi:hypothetical protein
VVGGDWSCCKPRAGNGSLFFRIALEKMSVLTRHVGWRGRRREIRRVSPDDSREAVENRSSPWGNEDRRGNWHGTVRKARNVNSASAPLGFQGRGLKEAKVMVFWCYKVHHRLNQEPAVALNMHVRSRCLDILLERSTMRCGDGLGLLLGS